MKILITGGTGFIGQNLIPRLMEECKTDEIMLLCRDVQSAIDKLSLQGVRNFRVEQAEDWDKVIEFNPELVIHLAAYITSANDLNSMDKLIDTNIIYSAHLLHALSQCTGMKLFLNTGSFAEYRRGPRQIDNAYLYSVTKSAFRSFLDYYAKLKGFKYITAVPYSVYGGKPTVKRIMDYMMDAMDAAAPVDMTPGQQVLDFIHVDDIAAFFLSVIHRFDEYLALEQGSEFHLGTGRGYTLREVAKELERITGKPFNIHWGGRGYRERDTMYAVAPVSSNREDLWKSRISLHEGISRFVQSNNDES
jgi:CDP-paratose synthetase